MGTSWCPRAVCATPQKRRCRNGGCAGCHIGRRAHRLRHARQPEEDQAENDREHAQPRQPQRPPSPRLVWAGVLGNLAIIVLWAWTRTIGIPIFDPHTSAVEEIGAIDVVSKIVEALLIACLVILLRGETRMPDASDVDRQVRSLHPASR
jgi:hypothetical protein